MIKKAADIRRPLERRMMMWKNNEFDQLLQEAIRCDRSLRNTRKGDVDDHHIVRMFTRVMLNGRVRAAVRWLSEKRRGSVLQPSDLIETKDVRGNMSKLSVWEILNQKHPDPRLPSRLALLNCDDLPSFEEVEISSGHIIHVAHLMQGGAGPGGCDAVHWQDSLLCYGAHHERLHKSVASLCHRLANSIVPWADIRGLITSHLIVLDKCPGVRPVGIGEALWRVVSKAICLVTRFDAEEVCGVTQLCAKTRAGIKGAVDALSELFEENWEDGWGLLIMDAANAFNSLNRITALWNVRVLWPRCSRFLFNSYR